MKAKSHTIAVVVFAAVLFGILFACVRGACFGSPADMAEDETQSWKVYHSDRLGFSFRYPDSYYLLERELGDGHRGRLSLVLTEDTEENRAVREGKSPGREGPVAISFDVYQSPDEPTISAWVTGNALSNFQLSRGKYEEVAVAGKPALYYSWSGLYEADNYVLMHQDYLLSIVVTYIFPDDLIRRDFEKIIKTLEFF
ncbi:hypothetical protein L0Y41_00220 [bacterium]|nr:hypothetical protein [bacterium]